MLLEPRCGTPSLGTKGVQREQGRPAILIIRFCRSSSAQFAPTPSPSWFLKQAAAGVPGHLPLALAAPMKKIQHPRYHHTTTITATPGLF